MTKNPFRSIDQVMRIKPYIDELARRAWDREDLTADKKKEVNYAVGNFFKSRILDKKTLINNPLQEVLMLIKTIGNSLQ